MRRIDGVLDLSWLHGELAPFYSHTGRASIDPELMMRMLIIGYVFAIRSDEHDAAKTMIDRARQRLGLRPRRLAADTAYGAAPILKWLMDRGIEPHIPVWDKSRRADGTFSRPDFTYDKGRDLYICPGAKTPKTAGPQDCGPPKTVEKVHEGRTLLYRASKFDCDACPSKPRCCPKAPSRKVPRDIDEDVRDHLRALANTETFETSRRKHKKVEMAFALLKPILKLDRLRLRGFSGARDEILLAATAQNLRKLAIYGARSPPGQRVHCIA